MERDSHPVELSSEQELLVAAALPTLSAVGIERLRRSVAAPLNWDLVFDLAAWHGLMPVLAQNLALSCADQLPDEIAGEFAARLTANVQRSLLAVGEIARVNERLKSAGIRSAPFKGPAQAAQLYGEPFLREFHDLDVLITPEDSDAADAILRTLGYVPSVNVAPEHRSLYMRSECDREYVHQVNGIHLELHWAITPPYFGVWLPAAELIERATPIHFRGVTVDTLSPEDLLLVLCVNGAKEVWEKLEWSAAVTVLLGRELDWSYLDRAVQRTAARRMLLIGLGLARDIFAAPVPKARLEQLETDRTASLLLREAKAWLFARHFQSLKPWQMTRFRLRARERMRDRAKYLLLRAVTPTHQDLGLVSLPRGFHLLYHLVRPSRLAAELFRRRSQRPPDS
jgi:hypothetical protein